MGITIGPQYTQDLLVKAPSQTQNCDALALVTVRRTLCHN